MRAPTDCPGCGASMDEGLDDCSMCHGTGRDSTELDGLCIYCHGSGTFESRDWPDCICDDEDDSMTAPKEDNHVRR